MPPFKWLGPVTDEVTVGDELAFDALPEETQMLANRVVSSRHDSARLRERAEDLKWNLDEVRDERDRLRKALEKIAEGVSPEDAKTLATGALAA